MASKIASEDVFLTEYKVVTAQFRALTEIRFKLLAFLPLGTIATVYLSKDDHLVEDPAIAIFAFVATLCIATYNKRNDQHYDELVSRAAELERVALGAAHGSFSQRPVSWLQYFGIPVEHRWPIGLIYASTAALWAYLATLPLLKIVDPKILPPWFTLISPAAVIAGWLMLRALEFMRRRQLCTAVLQIICSLQLKNKIPGGDSKQWLVQEVFRNKRLFGLKLEKIQRRVDYHWRIYTGNPDLEAASQLLAAITDLPARWIEDISSGRR